MLEKKNVLPPIHYLPGEMAPSTHAVGGPLAPSFHTDLKTSKDRPDEQNQGHLVRGCESKGVNPSHLLFNKASEAGRGMGELSVGMGGYRCALMGAWGSWRRAN